MDLRLVIELTTADEVNEQWRSHLSVGGAFVRGAIAEQNLACLVVLRARRGRPLELPARTVYTCADGVGVQLDGFDAAMRVRLQAWIDEITAPRDELDGETIRVQPGLPTVRFGPPSPDPEPEPELTLAPEPEPELTLAPEPELTLAAPDSDAAAGDDADDDDDDGAPRDPAARNVFERLRNLSVVEQLKCAREGEVHERMALERLYGKLVWEALLRNPRVTPHEVARIARMGALPRPLVELIVGNTAWLRVPEVRRALLTNSRLGADLIPRVLRLLPKHELRVAPNQTAYSSAVREAARKLLADS